MKKDDSKIFKKEKQIFTTWHKLHEVLFSWYVKGQSLKKEKKIYEDIPRLLDGFGYKIKMSVNF